MFSPCTLRADLGARGDGVVGGRGRIVDADHAVGDAHIARTFRRGETEAAADLVEARRRALVAFDLHRLARCARMSETHAPSRRPCGRSARSPGRRLPATAHSPRRARNAARSRVVLVSVSAVTSTRRRADASGSGQLCASAACGAISNDNEPATPRASCVFLNSVSRRPRPARTRNSRCRIRR